MLVKSQKKYLGSNIISFFFHVYNNVLISLRTCEAKFQLGMKNQIFVFDNPVLALWVTKENNSVAHSNPTYLFL